MSYPRPDPARRHGRRPVARWLARRRRTWPSRWSPLQTDKPVAQTVEESLARRRASRRRSLRRFRPGGTYYPSPGGLQEEVRSMLVEVEPLFVQERARGRRPRRRAVGARPGACGRSRRSRCCARRRWAGWRTRGWSSTCTSCSLQLGRPAGPWIGEAMELPEGAAPPAPTTMHALAARTRRRAFDEGAGGSVDGLPGAALLDVRGARRRRRRGGPAGAGARRPAPARGVHARRRAASPARGRGVARHRRRRSARGAVLRGAQRAARGAGVAPAPGRRGR